MGKSVRIVKNSMSDIYPFIDSKGECYTENGKYWRSDISDADLIEEIEDSTNPKDLIGIKKPSLSNIPASALLHQAQAHKHGHEKYGFYNWRKDKVQALVYIDAAFRHLLCYLDGEDCAEDSGINHLAHVIANCNILLDANEIGTLIDNRPLNGRASELIKQFTL